MYIYTNIGQHGINTGIKHSLLFLLLITCRCLSVKWVFRPKRQQKKSIINAFSKPLHHHKCPQHHIFLGKQKEGRLGVGDNVHSATNKQFLKIAFTYSHKPDYTFIYTVLNSFPHFPSHTDTHTVTHKLCVCMHICINTHTPHVHPYTQAFIHTHTHAHYTGLIKS